MLCQICVMTPRALMKYGAEIMRFWAIDLMPSVRSSSRSVRHFDRFYIATKQVLEAGADSIAVISAITKANDVGEAVRQWNAAFEAKRRPSSPSP